MLKNYKLLSVVLLCISTFIYSQNATTPGAVSALYPTITNIGIEWLIQGDANYNAVCSVKFKKGTEIAWHNGMQLKRVAAGQSQETDPIYTWHNKFSGSIFDLQPNTAYTIQLSLSDPDGGAKDTTITVSTRPVPRVTTACEIIDLPDGSNGTLTITRDGSQAKPLVYRSISRKATYTAVTINKRKWVYLIGLKINGSLRMRQTENCVVQRCSVIVSSANGYGIDCQLGTTNSYIADNVVIGPVKFIASEMGAEGISMAEGIQVTGCGNVIRNNYVKGFHDCLSHMEDDEVSSDGQIGNDWLFNDVMSGLDDGIEADFAFNNCRIIGNRFTNCFNAMSSQPGLGGPTYFIRNVVFNALMGSFKLNRNSVGDVILHNTIIKAGDGLCTFDSDPFDWALFENNLALGGTNSGWDGSQVSGGYGPGSGYACNIAACGSHCSFDYDAVGTYKTTFQARINGKNFSAVELHGRNIDSTAFANFKFPSPPAPEPAYYYSPQDLRPAPSCTSVVGKALLIPNVNDNFSGDGPDIGAYEAGQDLPIYGPRPEGSDEQLPYDNVRFVKFTSQKSEFSMIVSQNPFKKKTSIHFVQLSKSSPVVVSIYDAIGNRVRSKSLQQKSGELEFVWSGDDDHGHALAGGVYLIGAISDTKRCMQKVIISR